mmetsp:Transcript_29688/g.30093  ORF Transcript_29688/g.30093 Transcript_29688/m.30093 type:complete len:412 (-) Transcript_29688:77-1312(-)|eukprot:CAMPEP_0182419284 /NCGR_PEP_ID=MMETSP1167-20130531/3744_1 /TAXON_ID=2988 /ORGANISM="Mallomonas Sp, Strain CCMP3275" /LENGTH=411 /DNA_ID=CAMNT_0024594103 /DNA_START=53 /DNA_END=1288 /DNA_ORIENTATION=+
MCDSSSYASTSMLSCMESMDVSATSTNGFLSESNVTTTPSVPDESKEHIHSEPDSLPLIDRLLPFLIILSCALGVIIGQLKIMGSIIEKTTLSGGTNVLVAFGLMSMMYPSLAKVKWASLSSVFADYKLLGLTCFFNWVVCPFSIYFLAWLFFSGSDRNGLMSGLSLVGCARCFSMVLVWNHIAEGDSQFCAAIAALNSLLTVFLYSPYSVFFLWQLPESMGHQSDSVSISLIRVATCVLTYMGIPLLAAVIICLVLVRVKGEEFYYETYVPRIAPLAMLALLFTVFIIISSKSRTVIDQLPLVLYATIPMIIYFLVMFFAAYSASKLFGANYSKATAIAFTAASNNLEIAIAVAISSFGLKSDQSLIVVVVALIKIPTMLILVKITPYIKKYWFKEIKILESAKSTKSCA